MLMYMNMLSWCFLRIFESSLSLLKNFFDFIHFWWNITVFQNGNFNYETRLLICFPHRHVRSTTKIWFVGNFRRKLLFLIHRSNARSHRPNKWTSIENDVMQFLLAILLILIIGKWKSKFLKYYTLWWYKGDIHVWSGIWCGYDWFGMEDLLILSSYLEYFFAEPSCYSGGFEKQNARSSSKMTETSPVEVCLYFFYFSPELNADRLVIFSLQLPANILWNTEKF